MLELALESIVLFEIEFGQIETDRKHLHYEMRALAVADSYFQLGGRTRVRL
jgi:hypothetical protein